MNTLRIARISSCLAALVCLAGCGEDAPSDEPGTGGATNTDTTATGTGTNTNTSTAAVTAGTTFGLTIDRTWKEPDPAIGNEIGAYVPQFLLSIESVSADGTTAQVLVGVGKDNVQNTCSPTARVTATVTPFGLSIPELIVQLTNDLGTDDPSDDITVNAPVYNLKMNDIIPNTYAGDFAVTMDMRDIGVMFHQLAENLRTGQGVCDSLPTISPGVQCEPCASDSLALCLTMTATKAGAVELPGVVVTEVTTPCPI